MDANSKAALLAKINSKPLDKAALLARINAHQGIATPPAEETPASAAEPFDYLQPQTSAESEANQKYANDAIRQFAKGATFNAAPRLTALARSAVGKETYSEALAYEQAQNEDFEKENPGSAMVLQGIGGVVVPGPAMAGTATRIANAARANVATIPGVSANAARRLGNVAGVAAVAAPVGAVSGALESKDLTDVGEVATKAGTGAVIGAVAGPVLGTAAHKVGNLAIGGVKVADSVQSFFTGIGAQRRATDKIADTVERRHVAAGQGQDWQTDTRTSAAQFQNQVNAASVPGVNNHIGLATDELAALTRNNLTQQGVDSNDVAEMARRTIGDARTAGSQSDRLAHVVENLRPGYGVDGFEQQAQQLRQAANDAFDPFYDAVRQGQIPRPGQQNAYRQWVPMAGLTHALRSFPTLRTHYEAALQGAHMSPTTPGVTDATAGVMAARQNQVHADVLRRMRTSLSQAKNASPGGVEADGLALVDNILAQGPVGQVFQGHVRNHANAKALEESFEAGAGVWGTTGTKRAQAMNDFADIGQRPRRHGGPGQSPLREAEFLNGAAGALQKQINADTGNMVTPMRTIGSRENVDTMRQMFPPANVNEFIDAVEREGTLNDRAMSIIERATGAAVNRAELLNMGLRAYIKSKFNPGAGVADIIDKVSPGSRKQRRELVRQLTSGNQGDMDRLIANLSRRDAILARRAAIRSALAQGLIASDLDDQDE